MAFDRRPRRRPGHPEPPPARRRGPFQRTDTSTHPPLGATRHGVPGSREVGALLRPRLDRTVRIRARPHPLAPTDHDRPIPSRRVTQRHPTPVLRAGHHTARPATDQSRHRLDLDDQLVAAVINAALHEPRRAEPDDTSTTFPHPISGWSSQVQRVGPDNDSDERLTHPGLTPGWLPSTADHRGDGGLVRKDGSSVRPQVVPVRGSWARQSPSIPCRRTSAVYQQPADPLIHR